MRLNKTSGLIYLLLVVLVSPTSVFSQTKTKYKPDKVQSLLWKIQPQGIARPSYLYGTMHSKSKKVFNFNKIVLTKFDECQAFAAELLLDSATVAQAAKGMVMGGDYSLKKRLTPEQYERINQICKKELEMDLGLFDNYKPIYVLNLIQQADLMRGEMPNFLDKYLHDMAENDGKEMLGVEKLEEQTSAFNTLSYDDQLKQLIKATTDYEKTKKKNKKSSAKLLEGYLSGDLRVLLKMIEGEKEMDPKLKEALINNRNRTMAQRINEMVQRRSTFVAIGAAHLPGEVGVINLLRQMGYQVTAIPFEFDGSGYTEIKEREKNRKPKTDTWVQFTADDGTFSVKMPAKPNYQTQKATNEAGKEITSHIFMTMDMMSGRSYNVTYVENQPGANTQADDPQKMKDLMESRLKNYNGKVIKEGEFVYRGIKGREVVMEVMTTLLITMRAFNVGNRTYMLMNTTLKSEGSNDEKLIKRFFESFEVLKKT